MEQELVEEMKILQSLVTQFPYTNLPNPIDHPNDKNILSRRSKIQTENSKNNDEFVKELHKKFPPKRNPYSNTKLGVCDRARMDYHPDKQALANGRKWKVLCEEICKELNKRWDD